MNEIVITGCGSISALGNDNAALTDLLNTENGWRNAEDSGYGEISDDPAERVKGFQFNQSQLRFPVLKLDINSKYAIAACAEALAAAGLPNYLHGTGIRAGLIVANTYIGVDHVWRNLDTLSARGIRYITPYNCLTGMYSILSTLCTEFGVSGYNNTINQSLTSGHAAVKTAFERIKGGYEDVVIIVGTDPLNEVMLGGAQKTGVLSRRGISQPFDKHRDGAVLGEACGALILENADHAVKRSGQILARIAGIAFGSEERQTAPIGNGMASAIQGVLQRTGRSIDEVDFIYSNANSTLRLDLINGKGIKSWTERTDKVIPVTASKSFLGETLSAGGLMDVLAAVGTLAGGYLPGIRRLVEIDDSFRGLELLKQGRTGDFRTGLVNGAGIGGDCYSIYIEKV